MASLFVKAMDTLGAARTQLGENGATELTAAGVGELRVALFFALVRGMAEDSLRDMVGRCIAEARQAANPEDAATIIADLFVLAFQTRHCRGGKGEKTLFDLLLLRLYEEYPATVLSVVRLIPRFGCFKDYFRLLTIIEDQPKYEGLREAVIARVALQLNADARKLSAFEATVPVPAEDGVETVVAAKPAISLCAKYAPREGSALVRSVHGKAWFKKLRQQLFPENGGDAKVPYRKLVTRLTAALDIPEVKMCDNTYKDIDFGRVPSLCLNRCRKAFLNEKVDRSKYMPTSFKGAVKCQARTARGRGRVAVRKGGATAAVGGELRYPDREDRMLCRQHLLEAIRGKALHGKVLHPHTLVSKLMPALAHQLSTSEKEIFNVQWEKIRENLVQSMEKLAAKAAEAAASSTAAATPGAPAARGIDFTKLVPLVDVSGSMAGDPMHAAIAMGTLVSEVNHTSFRNRFISFDSTPRWIDLSGCADIADKVRVAANSPWGGSTDLLKAFTLILDVVEQARLPAEEVPDLIIFSDMQFDQAAGSQAGTHLEIIRKKFAAVGKKICGLPYPLPRIIFWNLRAVMGGGYPASADDENVQLLSGFSPALLEVVLSGEPLETVVEEVEEAEDGSTTVTKKTKKVTPYETLRKVLDNSKYDAVRAALGVSQEKELAAYSFAAAVGKKASSRSAGVAAATAGAGSGNQDGDEGEEDVMEVEDWEVV